MTGITETITLLDRTPLNRTPSTDLPSSVTGTTTGDLFPWKISMKIIHSTLGGRITNGELKLKLDINNRFVRTVPILIDEFAKNKYLIEWKGTQTIGGTPTDSKIFVFQITNAYTDIDKNNGMIVTIKLTEQQYRFKESLTSVEHRFLTPFESFLKRVDEINNFQGSNGVQIESTAPIGAPPNTTIPNTTNLKQNYDPQAPTPILDMMQDVLDRLGDPNVTGGVFRDYYMDFEPLVSGVNQRTKTLEITAEEFGAQDSGIVLDPKTLDTITDSTTEQTNITDNLEYKNNVILRCNVQDGSLPMEHARYASNFLHSAGTRSSFKGRSEWNSGGVQYKKGDQVKRTITTSGVTVVRFFEALIDNPSSPANPPEIIPTTWKEDFIVIPAWSSTGRYFIGDVVYHIDTDSLIKFYKCKADKTNVGLFSGSSSPPTIDTTTWQALHPTIPNRSQTNFTAHFYPSPWLTDLSAWQKNLAGRNNLPPVDVLRGSDGKYVGYAVDWNITRDTYDQQDFTQIYDTINVKMVYDVGINNPVAIPTREIYHGMRVRVGSSPSGDFTGHANQIAEFDASDLPGTWRFSRSPTTNDTISNLKNAIVYRWNGSSWVSAWDLKHQTGPLYDQTDKPTPFHVVGNVLRTKGATGIPASAIEWRYKWSTVFPLNLEEFNNNSNGVWINFWFPFPKEDVTGAATVGYLYGGNGGDNSDGIRNDLKFCTLNTFNYTLNRKGKIVGWNNGLDSEDLGRITGVAFKIKVGLFNDSYHETDEFTSPVVGFASIPMVFWAVDVFDRVWFFKFNLRANNQWELVEIPFGELAPRSLHIPRFDELPNFWGYVIPFTSFTLKEKEYSGVSFDWRFVRGWGIFWEGAYEPQLHYYENGTKAGFEKVLQVFQQLARETTNNLLESKVLDDIIVHASSIALDEFHFKKELIVNSDDTVVDSPRTAIENRNSEFDYFNAKKIALGRKKRLSFFPQTWHVRTHGDVRMRVGKKFKVKGDQVPSGEVEMVCAEVTHLINHEGYFMEVSGQRKFEVEG